MFKIENLTGFADNKYPLEWHRNKDKLRALITIKLERLTSWLKQSGMKVIELLFHKRDTNPITITINRVNDVMTSNLRHCVL